VTRLQETGLLGRLLELAGTSADDGTGDDPAPVGAAEIDSMDSEALISMALGETD
jgi:hypothetical protein